MKDKYYRVLELKPGSTEKEVKSQYRKLSKKYHPDINPSEEAKEKMSQINEAYEILTGKREVPREERQRPGGNPFGGFNPFTQYRNTKPNPIIFNFDVTLEEVYRGVEKEVNYTISTDCETCFGHGGTGTRTCQSCNGTGLNMSFDGFTNMMGVCNNCAGKGVVMENICNTCNGAGNQIKQKTLKVKIPKGRTHGNMVLNGVGNQKRGVPGDVICKINLLPHNRFLVDGLNLYCKETVSVFDLLLGVNKEVQTIDGKVKIDIPKLSEPTKTFRLKGKGLIMDNGQTGNLYVNLGVKMPDDLTEEQEDVIERLRNETT